MPMGIVVISCVRPSVQPSMGLGLCISYKALGRNGLQFGMLMYPDGLHSAFMDAYGYCCWSVCPSICPFVRLRHFQVAVHLLTNHLEQMALKFGAKEGGSHYWEMAVAITCGYGGYLLPLLAAHSSLKRNSRIFHQEAHTVSVKPAASDDAISVSCQPASWFGWFQHRFHRMPPYATWNLTVFDASLLKYNMACCDLLLVRCRRLQRSAKCKYTHYRSTYCLGLRGADVTMWDSHPGSREFGPSRTGEPLNSRSRILAPNWREITGVDCISTGLETNPGGPTTIVRSLEPHYQRYHEKSYQQMDRGDCQRSLHSSW